MDNIQYFLSYSAQNKRPISLAVCPITLNFLEIPEIVDFCNRNYARIYFNTVDRPYRLSLMSLDYSDLEKAKNLYKAYLEKPNSPFVFQNKQAFEHMLNFVSSLSEIAKNNSYANYSFMFGGTNDNIEEIKKLDTKNVAALKLFLGSSTGNMLVDDQNVLKEIFEKTENIITTNIKI